ncbi:MAG: F0F1 ATP synthase subunit A [Planctomycetaceae bacterium]|jgi:F-type H+-transporting ATPase subunit a|nr:F0F1 ATP synthase subunit A [Planctomycetaceae bacterium]
MSSGINIEELVAGHVKDTDSFHIPFCHVHIPQFLVDIGITKFVLIEFAVVVLMCVIFLPLAVKIRGGQPVKGRFWNMIEVFLLYMRDEVIVPSIGKQHASAYLPYLWTLFFFVLFCNLGGMLPWAGSPTGSVMVTGVLSICTLAIVIVTGIIHHGFTGFWLGMIPPMEGAIGIVLAPFMFVLELFSFFVKHCSLCIRLMANMFGGHLMIAVFLAFIPMSAWAIYAWLPITFLVVVTVVCISFLELFVAFLQAYIFTFLTSVYIGMAIHQH